MDIYQVKKGATTAIAFQMFDAADHLNGKNGLTCVLTMKRPGATPGAAFTARDVAGSITGTGTDGWYIWVPTATDTDTFGFYAIQVTATGADPKSFVLQVVAQDPYTLILDTLTSGLTTVGSIGKLLVDNLNDTITSRMATFAYTAPPTAAAIGTAVWETLTSGVTLVGSFGKLIKDMLDQAISSRMATFTYTAPPSVNAIGIGVRTELATELTKIGSIYAAVDEEIGALTTNLQTANTGITTANAALVTLGTNLATTDGKVDTAISAVSDVNDAVSAVSDAVDAIPATDLTALTTAVTAVKTNTDKLANVTAAKIERTFKGFANKTSFDPETGVGIIYDENGSTPLFTYQLVTNDDGVITSKTPA